MQSDRLQLPLLGGGPPESLKPVYDARTQELHERIQHVARVASALGDVWDTASQRKKAKLLAERLQGWTETYTYSLLIHYNKHIDAAIAPDAAA